MSNSAEMPDTIFVARKVQTDRGEWSRRRVFENDMEFARTDLISKQVEAAFLAAYRQGRERTGTTPREAWARYREGGADDR